MSHTATELWKIAHIFFCIVCSNGDVRLVGGRVESEGTVEVCSRSVWGAIMSSGWTYKDAIVVCNQLGHPSGG